jgi:hypothetical protein
MNTLIKPALGLKKANRDFKITLDRKLAEHFYLSESKTRFLTPRDKLYHIPSGML